VPTPQRPLPTPEVHVSLEHLPKGAEVRLDGKPVLGADIPLPRGSGMHAISIRPKGKGADMLIEHDASSDGRYDVGVLIAPRNLTMPRAKEVKPRRTDKTASGLMRRPDF
jgi:hypothetical protein